ncbi:MAG: DUF1786 domain-containing protein [Bacillota bacterium]
MDTRVLAIDVGGGTQDILLWDPEVPIENCIKLVLPSPTRVMAQRIRQLTAKGESIHLSGVTMGGGPVSRAVRDHIKAGLAVSASKDAARTLSDDLEEVVAMGIRLLDGPEPGARVVELRDVDLTTLSRVVAHYGVSLPERVAVAVQDHGHCPGMSDRVFRFSQWEAFIEGGGPLDALAYTQPPDYLTRMQGVVRSVPGAMVMDTGPAAVAGCLEDPRVASMAAEGAVLVNVGNMHTVAFIVRGERVFGVYEDHTRNLDEKLLRTRLDAFIRGELSAQEVLSSGGHGAFYHREHVPMMGARNISVTGPNRRMARGISAYEAAPHGDMMLTGCFGLIRIYNNRRG